MTLMSKITTFARSPQGKKALAEAKRLSKDPATRQKIDRFREQVAKRRTGR